MSEIIDALDREWHTFDRRPDVRTFMIALAADPQFDFRTASALVEGVRRIGRADPARADIMLAELMRIATHDVIAQRIVLQALLPGLCSIISRVLSTTPATERERAVGEVVSLMGLRIASFPIDRRPRAIACNILRDVERDYRTGSKQRAAEATRCSPDPDGTRHADHHASNAFVTVEDRVDVERAIRRARTAGVVASRDLALVVATRLADRPTEEVAHDQRLSHSSALRARHRAEARLSAFYAGETAA